MYSNFIVILIYTAYAYIIATNGQMIAEASISTQTSTIDYFLYQSLNVLWSDFANPIYILCHFTLLLLYQLLQSHFHMWLHVFGRFLSSRQFLVCTTYNGLKWCIPQNRTWYVYPQPFKSSGFIGLLPAFANNDHNSGWRGVFVGQDWGYQVRTNKWTCPFQPR